MSVGRVKLDMASYNDGILVGPFVGVWKSKNYVGVIIPSFKEPIIDTIE